MKNKYTKKQITEAIKYWENQLRIGNYKKPNKPKVLNEGWLGGIIGFLLSNPLAALGTAFFGPIGLLAGWVTGTYAGHKIQEWFHKRNAVKNMTDEGLLLLAAAKGAGPKGISKEMIKQLQDKGVKMDAVDELIRINALVKSGSSFKITADGKKILDDAGYDENAMDKTAKELKANAESKK